MSDPLYQKLVHRWEEVMDLPPQRLGVLTPAYKQVTKRLKVMPWPLLFIGGMTVVVGLYMLLGSSITFFVTLLQRGF